jgi:hypothetical protein
MGQNTIRLLPNRNKSFSKVVDKEKLIPIFRVMKVKLKEVYYD